MSNPNFAWRSIRLHQAETVVEQGAVYGGEKWAVELAARKKEERGTNCDKVQQVFTPPRDCHLQRPVDAKASF